jgi:hypothetical protein
MRFLSAPRTSPSAPLGTDIYRLSHDLEHVLADLHKYEQRLKAVADAIQEEKNE